MAVDADAGSAGRARRRLQFVSRSSGNVPFRCLWAPCRRGDDNYRGRYRFARRVLAHEVVIALQGVPPIHQVILVEVEGVTF